MELFIIVACTRRQNPGDSSLAGAHRQPLPGPSPSTQLPTLSRSARVAAGARTWLPPWAFGSQSQAWPGGRSLEAGMGLSRPGRRQRWAGRTSTLATVCRHTQSPLCPGRDGIQTHAGASPWQTSHRGTGQAKAGGPSPHKCHSDAHRHPCSLLGSCPGR